MAVDKITPNDSRIKHCFADVNGHRWHYIDAAVPAGKEQKGTIFLVHGYPDLWLAWRYQIPMLLELGLRIVVLECMGYGQTGAPEDLQLYGFKAHADAIAGIAKDIGADRVILGGHDWGGAVVYRVAQWYPQLVSHVFSVATPYFNVSDQYVPAEMVVKFLPNFGYQLQFGSEDQRVEKAVQGEGMVRKWLTAMYGGKLSSGRKAMSPEKGVDLDAVKEDDVGPSPFFDDTELDYYVSQYALSGVHGPCNWYRTRKVNFDDERALPEPQRSQISQPVLFIQALHDDILTPKLSEGMEKTIPKLTRGEVPASHWALWHTPSETNEIIKDWFQGVVFEGKSRI